MIKRSVIVFSCLFIINSWAMDNKSGYQNITIDALLFKMILDKATSIIDSAIFFKGQLLKNILAIKDNEERNKIIKKICGNPEDPTSIYNELKKIAGAIYKPRILLKHPEYREDDDNINLEKISLEELCDIINDKMISNYFELQHFNYRHGLGIMDGSDGFIESAHN